MFSKEFSAAERAFWMLTFFFTLFFTALGGGQIFFQIVNSVFPDPLGASQEILRIGFSFLLISAPIAFLTGRKLHRAIVGKRLPLSSSIRHWLEFIALFFAAATIIGDLATTLITFLNGELTLRFFFKILVILVIAGGIFGFFWGDLREGDFKKRQQYAHTFSLAFWLFVIGALVSAVTLLESPKTARNRELDSNTESNISNARDTIQDFYRTRERLPKNIGEIKNDPLSSGKFDTSSVEYTPKSDRGYELCADFLRDNRNDADHREWVHNIGRVCFLMNIPTDIVPLPKNEEMLHSS